MIEEFFMPLNRHFDSGFGAVADTFHDAAKALDADKSKRSFGLNGSRLPVFYLYRHAIELYLKSILTILHRRFCSNFPKVARDDFPAIMVNAKPKKIFQVHSIRDLYEQFRVLLLSNEVQIRSVSKTDWSATPEGLEDLIAVIEDADEASTMFRYPITLNPAIDAKKSSFKRIMPQDAIAEAHHRAERKMPGVKILAIENDNEEIVETFIHDADSMSEVLDALKQVAEMFSGAQFGMHHEFLRSE